MGPRYSPTWFSVQEGHFPKGLQGPYIDSLARPRSKLVVQDEDSKEEA
jgi:hypothetical protein